MKKITLLLFLAGFSAFAQKKYTPKTSFGMNLPLLIDNVVEINLRHQFHRNLRLDFSLGGSPSTRDKFTNGNYNNTITLERTISPSDGYTYYSYQSEKTSGLYSKIALNCVFNLPDFFYSMEEGNLKFYAGPLIGVSRYGQEGYATKTVSPKPNADGTIPSGQTSIITKSSIKENGTIFGSGFSVGLTIADRKDLSCDLGFDVLGFKRKSAFDYNAHTIGMGTNVVVRINYNLPRK